MLKFTLAILLGIAFFVSHRVAQKLEFTHFYTYDGLSHSTITAIEQDYQGFMWFGTFNGLNRFDGYSFKTYKSNPANPNTLTSSHIESIFEDSKNNLWIGTADGVNVYDRKSDAFEYYRYAEPGPYKYAVNTLEGGLDGKLWVGGWQGLRYADSTSKTLISVGPAPDFSQDEFKVIFDIEVEKLSGNLWLATNRGLYYYNQKQNTFKRFNYRNDSGITDSTNEAKSLYIDNKGVLWVGHDKGLCILRKGGNSLEPILPELENYFIYDIDQRADGSMLIGTEKGLYVFNEQAGDIKLLTKERSVNTLSDNVVRSIFQDHNDHLWLGTFYGLNYNGSNQNFGYFGKATMEKPGLKNPYVTTLCSNSEGHIFVGTADGIEVLEISSNGVQIISSKYAALASINKPIVQLATDNKENIFITAWPGGGYIYNWRKNILKSIHRELSPNCVLPVMLYQDNRLWIGCGSSLYTYDPDQGRLNQQNVFENYTIVHLTQDSRKNLLFGGQGGMIKYNPVSNEILHYKYSTDSSQSLPANVINYIHEDQEKNLWVATEQGLFLVDKANKVTSFRNRLGFEDDDVKAIAEDNHHNLWISTTNQLYRFNRKTSVLRKFEISDGLLLKEFSEQAVLKMESGHLVFGGKQGLIVFQPDSIKDNVIPPNVVLTDFKILNQPVAIGSEMLPVHISVAKELNLNYSATEFSFEFVALNFSSTQKNHYAYKMEGFDENWNYSGTRRFASYTNLPAGREYIFRVKASNEDNVWNDQGTFLKIYIDPPFWETWWFKMLACFTVALIIYVGFRIRINNIRQHRILLIKQKLELEKEVKEKTADLVEANQKLKEQAEKIAEMNVLLQEDNVKLEHDVKDLVEARVMQKHVSFEEFRKIYTDSDACYKFIDELKSSKEFHCKKCNHHKFSKGLDYSRRCSKCNYVETIITGTIFAGIKFPITKAFYLLFLISEGKLYTVGELSELVDLRQQTCWTFKKRVEERTKYLNFQKNKDGWSHAILQSDLAHPNIGIKA